jgi:beta-barrel assembly-enhancing protease
MTKIENNSFILFLMRKIRSLMIGVAILSTGCSVFTNKNNTDNVALLPSGIAKGVYKDAPNPVDGLNFRRRHFGIARQADLDAYLNGVLARLQKVYTDEPKPAHVFIVPDSSYSANATEDGAIFIPYGLLLDLESEDELAALLAHEYSHILLGHHFTGNAEETWNYIHGLTNLVLRTKLIRQKGIPNLANEAALEIVQSAAIPVIDRSQEDAADKLGTDLLIAAGYNSIGMNDLLNRMIRWEELNAEQKALRALLLKNTSDSSEINSKSRKVNLTPIVTTITESVVNVRDWLRKKHNDTKERQDAIRNYIKTVHSTAPRPEKSITQWEVIKNKPSINSFLEGLTLMRKLKQDSDKVDAHTAKKLIDTVMKTQAADVPYVHYSAFRVYKSAGLEKKAMSILKMDEQSPDSLLPQHMELIAMGEKKSAKEGLKYALLANETLGEPPQLMPKLIQLYKKTGNKPAMARWHAQCIALGVNSLTGECDKQAQ